MPKRKWIANTKGNPDFGSKIKKKMVFEQRMTEQISIRLTREQKEQLQKQSPNGVQFARQAILDALEKQNKDDRDRNT